jgi:predicted ATPase/DNA-binding winged helix-turn-helix (wHTH) protein
MNPPTCDQPLNFGHFELCPAERIVRVDGQVAALGSRAFDLLLTLARSGGRLVSKQELLDRVWPGLVVEEHNIATQISTLRKLLGACVVATVPGQGYRFTATLQAAPAEPAEPTKAPQRHNLPEARSRFIGREAALSGLARLVPAARLLTLTGIGGCGKTRLALQFARQQLTAFADGVWFVDLAPLTQGERVAATCAAVLGLREEGDTPLLQRLSEHLAARHMLLVLDNCEHVSDAAAALVEALLAGSPGTRILATSREALSLSGEQIFPVRSLSLPATGDLAAVQAAESVRVFEDRARLVSPDFEVDADNAVPIAEICRRLDGIALAIELAAARVTMLSVVQIAERLDDRFRLLTGGSRALPRHQTLRAAMQWSYEQLAPAEQRVLRQVSVFAGGWTLQATLEVAQCADDYEALALLTALHDKSLLVVDRTADGDRPRYRMLETVRQYALQCLDDCGEAEGARQRHVCHFVDLAERAEPHWGGTDQDVWIARFRQEHDNLVDALGWCAEGPLDPQWGLRLAAATIFYWVWNGVELGHRLALAVLEHDVEARDTAARAGTLRCIAKLSMFRGRYQESLEYAQQALAVARRTAAPRPLVLALDMLASALNTCGRVDEALACHEEALKLGRTLHEPGLLTSMLNSIAESKRSAGRLDEAERCYREALDLARADGGRLTIVVVLNNLIRVLVARGRPDPARGLAAECLALVRHDKVGVDLLEASVGLASCLGDHAAAARFWGAADQKLKEWGYRHQPVDIEHSAPLIARSRQAVGEAAFAAAETAGRALDFEAAMLELQRWLEQPA